MKLFEARPIINKKNNQINFSIPRKGLSKRQLQDINSKKKLKFYLVNGKNEKKKEK